MATFGIGCLSVSVLASGQVVFTTVPPVSYEPVGIVSTLQRVPMAIIDPTKPFKDAIRLSYEDLGKQAQVKAADLDDGFAIVRTTTSGGKFLAYASVIDNRSGDPIYIPGTLWVKP